MDVRRTVVDHPLPVVFAAAFAVAFVATVGYVAGGGSTGLVLRLAAVTTVLFGFAAAFAAGPLAERYL
ncbi:hypothetical protein [Candidatus Halobonum tyrrellensis]|uniref:Uncharacterized protein n=1 Tax=Candidatus Halobonum tyrrellensis G22 TaxID=1324957 RepID=V4IZZ8_9EURY|nr:hypothetical protein [Candidatus Halobonum tyrrellensis]ESP88742.1 hypothetical protein K933_07823 [Candidatus Halobonum tyrrellensis G22]